MTVRPLERHEVDLAAPLAGRSFDDLSVRLGRPVGPTDEIARAHYQALHHHLHRTGSTLGAYDEQGALVGVALSSVRGELWQLALLVVEPGAQSAGAGSALLRAAMATAPAGGIGTFVSSRDARAMRAYRKAGFRLLPALSGHGPVVPVGLGEHGGVRPGDLDRDAERVGVAHLAVDIAYCTGAGADLLVADGGCALVLRAGARTAVRVLTATDPAEGQRLLRAALLQAGPGEVWVGPVAPQQDWAVDVLVEARVELDQSGPLAVSGVPDPLGGTCPPAAVLI